MLAFRLALILALVGFSAARAQAPALSVDRDVFTVGDCAAPIPLRFVTTIKPAAIRTGDIAPRPAASPPGWTIEWDRPSAADAAINEYASQGHIKNGCPGPGLFGVPLTIYGQDQSKASLELTLVRVPEPVLDVPASVTLSVDRLWGALRPVPLLLREIVAGAPDTRVAILGGELKSVSGEPTGIMLEPGAGSVVVKSGASTWVMLAPTRTPPPGAYTAKLTLEGAALKPGATVDVTYQVRMASALLLGVIALGIGLGWWINIYLAGRAALDAALLSGLRSMQALTSRATPQRDPAVQQRLLAVADLLQSSLEDVTTPDEVTARVAEAQAQAKEIEGKAAEAALNLQQSLATVRAMLRPNGQALDGQLATRLAAPLAELDTLQRMADAGDVEQTAARLQDYSRELPGQALPPLQEFITDLRTELDGLGKLPAESDLAMTRDSLRNRGAEVYQAHDLGVMLDIADAVARQFRAWMDLAAPVAMAARWREAARALSAQPALARRLVFAAEQAELLRRAGRDPLARLGTLGELARSVAAAMTDAAAGRKDVAQALERGDFVGAARLLAGEKPAESVAAPRLVQNLTHAPGPALSLETAGPVAVLRVKPLVPVGQESTVVLRWLIDKPPQDRVVWGVDPAEAATVQPVAAGAVVHPTQAGFLTVFLDIDEVRVAEARTYVGEVAEQSVYVAVASEGRRARAVIAVVTALLTAFAGYEVFEPNWFGTVGNFFGAFLWGFFGQFGLDRVRELARPLLLRTLPV